MLRALLLFALLSAAVVAAESSTLQITDAWIRAAPPTAKVMAGYLTLVNDGDTEFVIDKVASDDFGAIEIHEMSMQDGVMRMRRLPTLRVPAHGRVELKPGGLHLMMFRPQRALPAGSEIELRLRAANDEITVSIEVREPTM